MAKDKFPVTSAVRVLRSEGVAFESHLYTYEPRGGTAASSRALGVPEHAVVKTLVLEDDRKRPLVALMHGDREVSTGALARHLGVRSVTPMAAELAPKASGYEVGGTSPFGLRKPMPVFVQSTILDLPLVYVNGGKRGYLVSLAPSEFVRVLGARAVDMATSS